MSASKLKAENEMLREHVRRLSGCLLVIAGAQGVSEASLRNVAYEATQVASVETVARRLGVSMPRGASAGSVGAGSGMVGGSAVMDKEIAADGAERRSEQRSLNEPTATTD